MRPHHLEIEAFGPYAEAVSVPFDALAGDGLFLIHGTTGSGKTYLLDALCFALYGEVSGERTVKGLRSDHAAPQALPRVALEFSAAGGRWLVERQPACEVARSRGSGTTGKPARATLWRLQGEERQPAASGVQEVGREIVRLLGLDANQFRQVILLPQGRFAEVLRARAEERETLLKTLFDTALYERVMGWLAGEARAAAEALEEQRRRQQIGLERIEQLWTPWAADPVVASEGTAEFLQPAALPERLRAMEARVEHAGSLLTEADAAVARTQEALARSRSQAEQWDARQKARQRLQELDQQQPAMARLQARLVAAEQAEALRASLTAEAEAQQRLEQGEAACQRQLQQLRRLQTEAIQPSPRLAALKLEELPLPAQLTAVLTELAMRQGELERLVGLVEKHQQARQAVAAAVRTHDDCAARIAKGEALLADKALEREARGKELQRATEAAGALRALEQAAAHATAVSGSLEKRLETLVALQQATGAVTEAESHQQQLQQRLRELRIQQLSTMAAHLAAGLEEGQACPVCGSLEHPRPAGDADAGGDDAAVTTLERQELEAIRALQSARDARARLQARLELLESQLATAAIDVEAPGAREHARSEARAVDERLREARSLAGQRPPLEEALRKLEQAEQRYRQRLQELREEELPAREALTRCRQTEADLEQELRASLVSGEDAAALLLECRRLTQACQQLQEAIQQRGDSHARASAARERLTTELAASGFADRDALRGALVPEPERQAWSRSLQEVAVERQLQQGRLAELSQLSLPTERPDLLAVEAAVASAEASRRAALATFSRVEAALEAIRALVAEQEQLAAELDTLQRQADLVQGVAARCLGQSEPHISLQRWVLSAYLEEICGHANRRLGQMSAGRYELRLSDASGQRRGSKAGLGLRVLDAYTGEEREVSSLSGGETFQASLALALGVADVVQAHSGGVALNALFIDEGFGSLDPDSLQLAMDELDRLREGGRMIGLISHVGALRERIRSGLQVVASQRGSRIILGSPGHA